MSVIINEATTEYNIGQIGFSLKIVPVEKLCGLSLCLCQNNNIRMLEEVVPLHFLRNNWQANNFFRIWFVSHGIALTKYVVKQGEVIFFPSDKKWPCYIENWLEKTRVRSSTWIKVGCKKDIYITKVSYTLKSTTNNYCERYNVMRYFPSFCRTE